MREFVGQNFAVNAPVLVDGKHRGVPLEEVGHYVRCNLMNREPLPGSIVENCLTVIKQDGINATPGQMRISGVMVAGTWVDTVVYGRWTPDGYEEFNPPKVTSIFRKAV